MFDTPYNLHLKTIWPTAWVSGEGPALPLMILTRERSRFTVWERRDLYYSIRNFHYRTRWWHFFRPDRSTAPREALDWVYSCGIDKDIAVVEEIVTEREERERELAAIDILLNEAG